MASPSTHGKGQVESSKNGLKRKEAKFRYRLALGGSADSSGHSDRILCSFSSSGSRRMLILRPMPGLIKGDSKAETLQPNLEVTDFGAWFSGLWLTRQLPMAKIDEYLKQVMPDLKTSRILWSHGLSESCRSVFKRPGS